METPERDFCPLTPRPPVLPRPEPIPRPTRLRDWVAPSASLSSLSFIVLIPDLSGLVDHANQMAHAGNHATHGRSVFQRGAAVHLVEPQTDQRCALFLGAANGAADLFNGDRLALLVLCHVRYPLPAVSMPSTTCAARIALLVRTSGSATARLQNGVLDTTLRSDILGMSLTLQSVKGGAHHVVGVGGAERLGNDVLNAEHLENRTHWTTGDDSGTGLGGAHQNLTSAVNAVDIVVQRTAFAQWHENQIALGSLCGLANGFRHFTRLAMTKANATLLVTNDHESRETKTAATLDHLGNTIDVNELIDELAVALFARATFFPTSLLCHCPFPCSFPEARVDANSRETSATRERVT